MKKVILYIHGKGGSPAESEHYGRLFPNCDLVGVDYKAETPWEAKEEFPALFDRLSSGYDNVQLIANSIGAYFSMISLAEKPIKRAWLISPMVNLEGLILGMMKGLKVSEKELEERGEIENPVGEPLSWRYLTFVRNARQTVMQNWKIPTKILYGSTDFLVPRERITAFAKEINAPLTVMDGGEHWFHTPDQMKFLDDWILSDKTFSGYVHAPAVMSMLAVMGMMI